MVQTTFTKQKRELAKASAWIDKIRAQEVRTVTYSPSMEKLGEARDSYVDFAPEEIAANVLKIVVDVVNQHGARQKANSVNTGHFSWYGVEADLTVPQLRALQNAHGVLQDLMRKLPRRNPKWIANSSLDGRPVFAHMLKKHIEMKTRSIPFEEDSSTRVRTYEERYEEVTHFTQVFEIDYGLDPKQLVKLNEMVTDFGTAIQVAIDEANAKGHKQDKVLEQVISDICGVFNSLLDSGGGNSNNDVVNDR